jgi:hypothetical protein
MLCLLSYKDLTMSSPQRPLLTAGVREIVYSNTDPPPVLQGGAVYEDHRDGFWDKAWDVLKGTGHVLKEALPDVAQAASIYASSMGSSGRSDSPAASWDPPNENKNRTRTLSTPKPVPLQPLTVSQSEPIARNALQRIEQARTQTAAPDLRAMQTRSNRILDEIAAAKGLPSYEQFHRDNGVSYEIPPNRRSLGMERFTQSSNQSSGFIQEDDGQIQRNLAQAGKPVDVNTYLRRQQERAMAEAQWQSRQAQEALAVEQAETERLKQQMLRMQQQVLAKGQSSPSVGRPLTAHTTKSRQDTLIEQAFREPANPVQDIIEQANGPERLPESRLNQAELNLDTMLAQGKINAQEYQDLAVAAKAATARNWLQHDGKVNTDGTVTYRGVKMDRKVAPMVAYADAKRYWDKDIHLSAEELGKAALEFGKGVYDFFIGDDIKTLTDPNATMLAKALAGGSLVLTLGGGFVEKAGLRAIEKLGGKFLIRVSGRSEQVFAKLAEKGLNSKQLQSYKHFAKKIAKGGETNVYHLPNGGKVFETSIISNNKQSYTVWEKYIDANGETKILGHRTQMNNGEFIHWHEKVPQDKLEVDLRFTRGEPYFERIQQLLKSNRL